MIFEIDPLIEIINNIEDSTSNTYVELDNPTFFFLRFIYTISYFQTQILEGLFGYILITN